MTQRGGMDTQIALNWFKNGKPWYFVSEAKNGRSVKALTSNLTTSLEN